MSSCAPRTFGARHRHIRLSGEVLSGCSILLAVSATPAAAQSPTSGPCVTIIDLTGTAPAARTAAFVASPLARTPATSAISR